MFSLFVVLLSFNESLAIFMVRPTLIDMNPVELKYYPFMISLNKFTWICNVLSQKNMWSKRNKRHKCYSI